MSHIAVQLLMWFTFPTNLVVEDVVILIVSNLRVKIFFRATFFFVEITITSGDNFLPFLVWLLLQYLLSYLTAVTLIRFLIVILYYRPVVQY